MSGGSIISEATAVQTALLRWAGCSGTAPLALELLGDDIAGRAALLSDPSATAPSDAARTALRR